MNSDRRENVFRSRHNRRSDRKSSASRRRRSKSRILEFKSKNQRSDLRSRISNLKRRRTSSRERRSVSPLHSQVHIVTENKIRTRSRSKSPAQTKSKVDDRKSYQKYLNERTNYLKSQLEGAENTSTSSLSKVEPEKDASHDSRHEKRSKKSKKKRRKERDEKSEERRVKRSRKSREKSSSRTNRQKEKRKEREQSLSLSESDTEERMSEKEKRTCKERNSKEKSNQREMDIERERKKREEARNKAKEISLQNDTHSNEIVMSTRKERNSRDRASWIDRGSKERDRSLVQERSSVKEPTEERKIEKQDDKVSKEEQRREKETYQLPTVEHNTNVEREDVEEEEKTSNTNNTNFGREEEEVKTSNTNSTSVEREDEEVDASNTKTDINEAGKENMTNQGASEKSADDQETSDSIKVVPQTGLAYETEPISSPEKEATNDNSEDDFEDFDEADLSSLSSSSLSLSSEEEVEVERRIATPLDGWKSGSCSVNRNLRNSGSLTPLSRDRAMSRSRSRSRPFEFRSKSKSRSISPPSPPLPSSSSHTWESRVSDFVRSIGGESRNGPGNSASFLETISCLAQPVATSMSILPPPIISSFPNQFTPVQIPPPIGHVFISVPPVHNFYPDPMLQMVYQPPPIPNRRLSQEIRSQSPALKNLPVPAPKPKVATPPPPHIEEEIPAAEEITLTPLMKFVGQKLADKKLTHLQSLKEGFFRYNLLSVATRGEWVAGKVLEAFDKCGFSENKMYNTAALKGRAGFKDFLQTAISSKKVHFGAKFKLTNQDLKLINCVVQLVVQYFTFDGSQEEEEDFNFEEEEMETSTINNVQVCVYTIEINIQWGFKLDIQNFNLSDFQMII